MKRTTFRISGTLRGPIWWPIGVPAEKSFEWTTVDRPCSLREIANSVVAREDGDFSSAPLMLGDAILTITRHRDDGMGHTSRSWYLAGLPSIADYTSADMPMAYEAEL